MTEIRWSIKHCPLAKRCRVRWDLMALVDNNPAIRFCKKCTREVYLCQTDEELEQHSALGHCVAVQYYFANLMYVGEPPTGKGPVNPDPSTEEPS